MIEKYFSIQSTLLVGMAVFALGCGGQSDPSFDDATAQSRGDETSGAGSMPQPNSSDSPQSAVPDLTARSASESPPVAAAARERGGRVGARSRTMSAPSATQDVNATPYSMQPLPPRSVATMDAAAAEVAGETAQPRTGQPADPLAMAVQARTAEVNNTTTMKVFYATDRESRHGLSPGNWWQIHLAAIIAGVIYLLAFAMVFLVSRKVFVGIVAFGSLAVFLFFAQSATVKWQKLKRLESHGDPEYLSDIRSFGPESLDYGTCEVTIPPSHQTGRLDSPSVLRLEFTEDPQKHVVLHRVIKTDQDAFYDQMLQVMDQRPSRQGLVFIHGYNVSFDDAVKRTAQIAHDLEFDGAPICYSWSSRGSLANYTHDMANADATVVALQNFLQETVRRTGNSTIHLIAHSMGNRALLQALDRIAVSDPDQHQTFGQLIMAAPDVSERDFRNRYVLAARQLARTVTLYASSRDRALIASTEIHGHDRAGLAGDNLILIEGVDTIDVSEIDTSLIGHSYYGDHPELIRDLRALVELSRPASQREWLKRIVSPGGFGYFRFAELLGRSATSNETQPARH